MTFPAYLCPPMCEQKSISARFVSTEGLQRFFSRSSMTVSRSAVVPGMSSIAESSRHSGSSSWSWTSHPTDSSSVVNAIGVIRIGRSNEEKLYDVPRLSTGAAIPHLLSRRL